MSMEDNNLTKNRREILSINIGQAGVQLGNAVWELYCVEHGVLANGHVQDTVLDELDSFKTFFHQTSSNRLVPRNIMVDLEPTVIDEIRTGPYRALYHPDQLVSHKEDAANNYARGRFTLGKTVAAGLTERIRKSIEICDNFQGFFLTHSFGGGTGSGLTALIFERLTTEYGKRTKINLSVFPSPTLSTAVVEPYNCLLNNHSCIDHSDLCIMMDNEAMYNISKINLDIHTPTYNCINRLIAHVYSSITASFRFQSCLNADIDSMCTNLVPYPRIHFPVVNHAPIISATRANHQNISVDEITRELFEATSQMLMVDPKAAKYMSCCLQYRGDIASSRVYNALFEIKKKSDVNFVDWCPTGFKIGINNQMPCTVPNSDMVACDRSMTMLTNSTSVIQAFKKVNRKFALLFSKRAMVHHFVGEGMEEGEFNEAADNMNQLVQDYNEAGTNTGDDDEGSGSGGRPSPSPKSPNSPASRSQNSPAQQASRSASAISNRMSNTRSAGSQIRSQASQGGRSMASQPRSQGSPSRGASPARSGASPARSAGSPARGASPARSVASRSQNSENEHEEIGEDNEMAENEANEEGEVNEYDEVENEENETY